MLLLQLLEDRDMGGRLSRDRTRIKQDVPDVSRESLILSMGLELGDVGVTLINEPDAGLSTTSRLVMGRSAFSFRRGRLSSVR